MKRLSNLFKVKALRMKYQTLDCAASMFLLLITDPSCLLRVIAKLDREEALKKRHLNLVAFDLRQRF